MTDLPTILPDFSTGPYTHLIPSLDRHGITVADLLSLDALEVAKRATLPILDLRRLAQDIVHSLQEDLHISATVPSNAITSDGLYTSSKQGFEKKREKQSAADFLSRWNTISILDPVLDKAIGGGIPTGYVTEITGESAAGKTQFLLTLLLSAQLPPPLGLSRSSVYISTEAPLSTTRLAQLLESHPHLSQLSVTERPSLARVLAIPVQDLESQDHIVAFQLPNAIRKYNVGLVVVDSVAANYRAEHGSAVPRDLANRAVQLAKLGKSLRDLAKEENIAVVVTNQVSDRFEELPPAISRNDHLRSSSPMVSSSPAPAITQGGAPPPAPLSAGAGAAAAAGSFDPDILQSTLSLDFQQRFFSGWGDEIITSTSSEGLKTPALGLAWTNQIACRIALRMEARGVNVAANTRMNHNGGSGGGLNGYEGGDFWKAVEKKRRFFRIVFAPWVEPTSELIEYEIRREGVTTIIEDKASDIENDQV